MRRLMSIELKPSVRRFRDIRSDRARNSTVTHASFHLDQIDSVTYSKNEMEPPVCLEGHVPGLAFSVRRFRDIRSDRARNSTVPHASFHLDQIDSVTCTGLPCFLHLFKLSVYIDLASTSQVALMLPSISVSRDKYFYKKR